MTAFVALVAAAAPVLLMSLIRAQPHVLPNDNKLAFMLFAVLLFLGETQPRLWMRFGDDGEVTPGWAFAFAMVLLGGPAGAVIVMVLANLYIDVRSHKGALRIVFNTSQVDDCPVTRRTRVGGVRRRRRDHRRRSPPARASAPRSSSAVLMTFVVNAALTATVLCLHLGVSPITIMREAFALSVAVDGALLALAPVFVIAIEFSILMLPLLAITSFLVFHSARTALKREHEANHDPLTGLLNRRAFDERLTNAVDLAEYDSHPLVLIMDLDRFKDINDRLGHPIGDKLLRSFAERLERVLPARASAARLGGDEFAVIVLDLESLDEAKLFVSRLHLQLSERHLVSGFPLSAAVSIGAAFAPLHGASAVALVAAADLAMYRAKQFGSGIEFASTTDRHHDLGRVGLLTDLTAAIGTDQIIVHYQPLVRLSDGTIESVEALIRWHHPVYGSIPPDEFIGMAEQTDLIGPLTESVFRTAIQEVSTMGATMPKLCINVAARNLLDRQFANNVLGIMHELQFPGRLLEMEITERDIVTNSERKRLDVGPPARCGDSDRDRRLRHGLLVVPDAARPARRPV